jgi:hypothetical protein
MTDRIVWRPEALEEFEEAIAWYSERSILLPRNFSPASERGCRTS